jgi:hypothetical protein
MDNGWSHRSVRNLVARGPSEERDESVRIDGVFMAPHQALAVDEIRAVLMEAIDLDVVIAVDDLSLAAGVVFDLPVSLSAQRAPESATGSGCIASNLLETLFSSSNGAIAVTFGVKSSDVIGDAIGVTSARIAMRVSDFLLFQLERNRVLPRLDLDGQTRRFWIRIAGGNVRLGLLVHRRGGKQRFDADPDFSQRRAVAYVPCRHVNNLAVDDLPDRRSAVGRLERDRPFGKRFPLIANRARHLSQRRATGTATGRHHGTRE